MKTSTRSHCCDEESLWWLPWAALGHAVLEMSWLEVVPGMFLWFSWCFSSLAVVSECKLQCVRANDLYFYCNYGQAGRSDCVWGRGGVSVTGVGQEWL